MVCYFSSHSVSLIIWSCHHYRFASLFTQSLPVEYLNRVRDIFLYEGDNYFHIYDIIHSWQMLLPGVVFLFRVGLTLIHCCRNSPLSTSIWWWSFFTRVYGASSSILSSDNTGSIRCSCLFVQNTRWRCSQATDKDGGACKMSNTNAGFFSSWPCWYATRFSILTTKVLICFCVLAFICIYNSLFDDLCLHSNIFF